MGFHPVASLLPGSLPASFFLRRVIRRVLLMPRPKNAPELNRPHRVWFRLTGAEMAKLADAAGKAGVPANEYARMKAIGSRSPVGAQFRQQQEPPGMFELRHQLIRVGTLMNQIARRLNMVGEHEPQELTEASRDLREIFRRILSEITFH